MSNRKESAGASYAEFYGAARGGGRSKTMSMLYDQLEEKMNGYPNVNVGTVGHVDHSTEVTFDLEAGGLTSSKQAEFMSSDPKVMMLGGVRTGKSIHFAVLKSRLASEPMSGTQVAYFYDEATLFTEKQVEFLLGARQLPETVLNCPKRSRGKGKKTKKWEADKFGGSSVKPDISILRRKK